MLLLLSLVACADMGVKMEVVFDSNLGEDGISTVKVKNPQDVKLPPDPVRENYIFDGWYLDNGEWEKPFTVQALLDLPVSEEMSLTVYAKWLGEPYVVHFDCTTADAPIADVTVRYGKGYRLPVPSNGREKFLGWMKGDTLFTDEKGLSLAPFEETEDVTLVPLWKEGRVDISLESGEGNPQVLSAWLGDAIGALPMPEKAEYLFLGWFTSREGGEQITAETVSSFTADTTLYAHWATQFCTVTFDKNGGVGSMKAMKVEHGKSFTLPACSFTKASFHFVGWDLNGKLYQAGAQITDTSPDSLVLRATWSPNTCTVYFDGYGGASGYMAPIKLTAGENATLPACGYTQYGKVFTGWTCNFGTQKVDDRANITSLITSDGMTLYMVAQWRPLTYTIHFEFNGATYDNGITDLVCDYDEYVYLSKFPFRDGYEFKGWKDPNGKFVRVEGYHIGDITTDGGVYVLTAVWEPTTYYIYFDLNGGDGDETMDEVKYLNTLTFPTCCGTYEGKIFKGWFTNDIDDGNRLYQPGETLVITNEMEFYASWEDITDLAHSDSDGGESI